jgi:predicted ATPase
MTDGKTFPAEVVQQIIAKTDGVPLFIEEMTKAILESGHLKEVAGHYTLTGSLSTLTIPTTLQDSLMARLDRLVSAKGIAQLAAVIGRQFAYELLQVVSQLDAMTLQRELGRLVEAELVYQRGLPPQSTYVFKHALIQDAAYESLLKSARQHYHQRIAQVLETQFPETTERQPELLAHHFTEAGLTEKAVHFWQKAGQRASERSAYVEAITHLRQGLTLLQALPETPARHQKELEMQVSLGPALITLKGYGASEVGQVHTRAQELCQHVGESPQTFRALWGLRAFYYLRAELSKTRELGVHLLHLAQRQDNTGLLIEAHRSVSTTAFHLGEFQFSRTHLLQVMELYAPHQHQSHTFLYGQDPGMVSLSYQAMNLWILGYPSQALQRSFAALDLHQKVSHAYSLAFALSLMSRVHQLRREEHLVQERIEASLALCAELGFKSFWAQGQLLRGWGSTMHGQVGEGIAQMEEGLAAYRSTGGVLTMPYWLTLLAGAYGTKGQSTVALEQLGEALTLTDTTGERWYEAEIYRLKGELLLQQASDDATEAESCFQHAIRIAQNQQAKSWELRAATSLARLWQQQGKRAEARQVLGDVYAWFTEGFDTPDLKDAKALLDELA